MTIKLMKQKLIEQNVPSPCDLIISSEEIYWFVVESMHFHVWFFLEVCRSSLEIIKSKILICKCAIKFTKEE